MFEYKKNEEENEKKILNENYEDGIDWKKIFNISVVVHLLIIFWGVEWLWKYWMTNSHKMFRILCFRFSCYLENDILTVIWNSVYMVSLTQWMMDGWETIDQKLKLQIERLEKQICEGIIWWDSIVPFRLLEF